MKRYISIEKIHTSSQKNQENRRDKMDKARKKIRVCLICVVSAAVIMGFIYFFLIAGGSGSISEGTLVYQDMEETQ